MCGSDKQNAFSRAPPEVKFEEAIKSALAVDFTSKKAQCCLRSDVM